MSSEIELLALQTVKSKLQPEIFGQKFVFLSGQRNFTITIHYLHKTARQKQSCGVYAGLLALLNFVVNKTASFFR